VNIDQLTSVTQVGFKIYKGLTWVLGIMGLGHWKGHRCRHG